MIVYIIILLLFSHHLSIHSFVLFCPPYYIRILLQFFYIFFLPVSYL
jgi:hypothetical protein